MSKSFLTPSPKTTLGVSLGGHTIPEWVKERLTGKSVLSVEEDFLTDMVRWFVDGVEVLPPEVKRS